MFESFYNCIYLLSGALELVTQNWTCQCQNRYGFSSTACDQVMEQTFNRDSKTKGRITGFTLSRSAVQRWILSQSERGSITNKCHWLGLQNIRNMMGQVRVVSQFFNAHPKRFAVLNEEIESLLPDKDHKHLLDVCRTRWIARIDGLGVFVEVYEAVV